MAPQRQTSSPLPRGQCTVGANEAAGNHIVAPRVGDTASNPEVARQVRRGAPRWTVHAYEVLGSTNDAARDLAREGAPDGTTVWARTQSSGRGRRGRSWSSPEGNLPMSMVLRGLGPEVPQLGFVAALAVADAVDALCCGPRARLKWPNDVLLNNAKLAGVLLEVEQTQASVVTILGIGVNVRHFPSDTSLRAHGVEVAPEAMLRNILDALGARWQQWSFGGFGLVRSEWEARGPRRGDSLKLRTSDRELAGLFVGLDSDGSLLVLVEGVVERFPAAEIIS